jgi:hypothetical protein
MTENPFTTLCP